MNRGRDLAQPLDLAGHEVELVAGAAVRSREAPLDRLRKVLRNERRDVEGTAIPRGDREHDADAGLCIGRQHGVDIRFLLRLDGQKILDRGDAVAQGFRGADEGAQAHLLVGSPTEALRIRVHHPDVEGQFFEQPLRHHVMRMVVCVHEPRNDELAGGVEDFDAGLRRNMRRDTFDDCAMDQDVGDRRLVDVAVVVIDPGATNEVARGRGLSRHE